MKWRDKITSNPKICHGQACFQGTRILVCIVLDNFSAGIDTKTILENYPVLKEEHLQAAFSYAADLARERVIAI